MKRIDSFTWLLLLSSLSSFSLSLFYYQVGIGWAVFVTAWTVQLSFAWKIELIYPREKPFTWWFSSTAIVALGIFSVFLSVVLIAFPSYPESIILISAETMFLAAIFKASIVSTAVTSLIAAGFYARASRQRERVWKRMNQVIQKGKHRYN